MTTPNQDPSSLINEGAPQAHKQTLTPTPDYVPTRQQVTDSMRVFTGSIYFHTSDLHIINAGLVLAAELRRMTVVRLAALKAVGAYFSCDGRDISHLYLANRILANDNAEGVFAGTMTNSGSGDVNTSAPVDRTPERAEASDAEVVAVLLERLRTLEAGLPTVLGHPADAEWCKAVDDHHAATEAELRSLASQFKCAAGELGIARAISRLALGHRDSLLLANHDLRRELGTIPPATSGVTENDEAVQLRTVTHSPDCDALDSGPDGIKKPCNCGGSKRAFQP